MTAATNILAYLDGRVGDDHLGEACDALTAEAIDALLYDDDGVSCLNCGWEQLFSVPSLFRDPAGRLAFDLRTHAAQSVPIPVERRTR